MAAASGGQARGGGGGRRRREAGPALGGGRGRRGLVLWIQTGKAQAGARGTEWGGGSAWEPQAASLRLRLRTSDTQPEGLRGVGNSLGCPIQSNPLFPIRCHTHTCPGPHPTTWRPEAGLTADRLGPGNQEGRDHRASCPVRQSGLLMSLAQSLPSRPQRLPPDPGFLGLPPLFYPKLFHRPQETSYLVELGRLVGE